jgi:hypothetical protein
MASGSEGPKQTRGYFVPLGNCVPSMLQYSGGGGAGGSFLPGAFSAASWAAAGTGGAGAALSSISSVGAGGLLKDMGKTVVSSSRTFRKVQLVSHSTVGAVAGSATSSGQFLSGYIELSSGSNQAAASGAAPAPVAYLPGLL